MTAFDTAITAWLRQHRVISADMHVTDAEIDHEPDHTAGPRDLPACQFAVTYRLHSTAGSTRSGLRIAPARNRMSERGVRRRGRAWKTTPVAVSLDQFVHDLVEHAASTAVSTAADAAEHAEHAEHADTGQDRTC